MRSSGISLASLAQQCAPFFMDQATNSFSSRMGFSNDMDGHVRRMPSGPVRVPRERRHRVAGAVNTSIDSSLDIFKGNHPIRLGVAHSSFGGTSSSTRRMNVQMPSGLALGLTTNQETGSALGMRLGCVDISLVVAIRRLN